LQAPLGRGEAGNNVFNDANATLGLSQDAYHFIGGIMHSAEALCAITNPVVNSYKRINAPPTLSGATWSPSSGTYAGNNRTHMIPIPDAGRIELRLAAGATNPYLLPTSALAAGPDRTKANRGPRQSPASTIYPERHTA